jgi:hypothetical protein
MPGRRAGPRFTPTGWRSRRVAGPPWFDMAHGFPGGLPDAPPLDDESLRRLAQAPVGEEFERWRVFPISTIGRGNHGAAVARACQVAAVVGYVRLAAPAFSRMARLWRNVPVRAHGLPSTKERWHPPLLAARAGTTSPRHGCRSPASLPLPQRACWRQFPGWRPAVPSTRPHPLHSNN